MFRFPPHVATVWLIRSAITPRPWSRPLS
ncbi:hypothetical protein HaLaN_16505, partial [Haematococcus lacustris]